MKTGSTRNKEKVDPKSFFDRIGKWIVFFAILGVVAAALTILVVNLAVYFGGNSELSPGTGIYWNFEIFFGYLIGFVVTPLVIVYVTQKRKEVMNQ